MTVYVDVKFNRPIGDIRESAAYINWIAFKMQDGSVHELEFMEFDRLQGEEPDTVRFLCEQPDLPPLWKKGAIVKWASQIEQVYAVRVWQLPVDLIPQQVTAFDIVFPAGAEQLRESPIFRITTSEFATIGSLNPEKFEDIQIVADSPNKTQYFNS